MGQRAEVEEKFKSHELALSKIQKALVTITKKLDVVVRLEERQRSSAESIEHAFRLIAGNEMRIRKLEIQISGTSIKAKHNEKNVRWFISVLAAILGAALSALASWMLNG